MVKMTCVALALTMYQGPCRSIDENDVKYLMRKEDAELRNIKRCEAFGGLPIVKECTWGIPNAASYTCMTECVVRPVTAPPREPQPER